MNEIGRNLELERDVVIGIERVLLHCSALVEQFALAFIDADLYVWV